MSWLSGNPPPRFGSGKFGTRWERMHRAYARSWVARLEVVERDRDGVSLEPQAATASAHTIATPTGSSRDMRWF